MIINIESVGIVIFDNNSLIIVNEKAKQMCKNIEKYTPTDLHNLKNSTKLVNSDNVLFDCEILFKTLFELSDPKFLIEIKDITELNKSKNYVNLIIESSFDGFFDWNIKTGYEYMSPKFWKMFGYEPHEKKHNQEEWKKIIHPEDLKTMVKNFDEHVKSKGKKSYSQQVRYYHKNGSIVYINCTGKIVEWDSDGNPLRMVGTHTNITDLVLQNEKLKIIELEKKTAEETLKIKMKFVNYIFHEVRNPLHALSAGIDIISSINNGPEINNVVDIMKRSIQKSTKILNDTLDYSKLEDGSIKLNKVNTDLSVFLDSIVQFYKLKAKSLKLKIFTNIEKNIYAYIDKDKFEQIISNILSNSMKFTKPNGIIYVNLENIDNLIKCSIEDTGCGIEKKNIELVTEPYNCINAPFDNSGVKSIGIGLSFVKKLLELHDSNIIIESELNVGTTISFYLKKVNDKIEEKNESINVVHKYEKTSNKTKILLVDDDNDNNTIMHKLLSSLNYIVDIYTDGSFVLDNINNLDKYDVIILDYLMTNVNGDVVVKKIRSIYKNKIGILTGCTTNDTIKYFLDIGVNKILEKPIMLDTLLNFINE